MRLVHIKPHSIRHIPSRQTTVEHLNTINSWLPQWTVKNNCKQVLVDLDALDPVNDELKKIALELISNYRSIVGEAYDYVLDEFRIQFIIHDVKLNVGFWPSEGRQVEFTLAQCRHGISVCLK